jgi:hypothetical protein
MLFPRTSSRHPPSNPILGLDKITYDWLFLPRMSTNYFLLFHQRSHFFSKFGPPSGLGNRRGGFPKVLYRLAIDTIANARKLQSMYGGLSSSRSLLVCFQAFPLVLCRVSGATGDGRSCFFRKGTFWCLGKVCP